MKNRLLRISAILIAGMLLLPAAGKAATVTTLLSQDFSGTQFPPTGWTANLVRPRNTYMYAANYGYWYRSTYGNNGANGSAVCWNMYTKGNGGTGATSTLTTPSFDASSFNTVADSTFVDFDLWAPYNYYDRYYGTFKLSVLAGSSTIATVSNPSAWTFYDNNNQYGFTDPSSYGDYTSSHWRHYHIAIPAANRTSSTQIMFSLFESSTQYYNYSDNTAIDNVVISNFHYDVLTLLGPASINFGAVPYLQTALPIYTRFVNNSTRAFTLSNYAISGTNAGDFTIVYAPTSVAVGAEDSVGISYTPQAAGARSATLSFSTDADVPANVSIPLNGYGLRPYISLPQSLIPLFAHVHVRFADTVFATVAVSNTGQVPLNISPNTFIDGDYPQMYSIVRLPATIEPDQTDSIIVAFAPTVEGLMDANLNIVSNANNGTQVLSMRGLGILARLDIDSSYANATTLNFDSVAVGVDTCFQITLFNPGSDTVAIEKNFFSSADYDFSMTPLTGTDTLIAPQTSKAIQVCFKPLKRGYRTAELRIVTNIPLTYGTPRVDTSQFTVLFTGTGVPAGNFQISGPNTVDSIALGKTLCQTDTLWNMGEADLTVTKLLVDDTSEFVVTPPALPFVLAAGSHETFTVCATPATMDLHTATVTGIAMNGEKADTAALSLDAYGVSNCTSDSIATNLPALTCVGDTSFATIVVTNCGNVATPYSATISGANASDFSIVGPAMSSNESAGGTATFTVAFAPQSNASSTATLTIVGGMGATVQLSGMGGEAAIAGNGTAP
ncbi:MAG TPA: choice-of-anchor D domain-containing protein, partial [Candidatus Kapabacteria bacterium]|nr:choice-of-anchor D domain-containing protein [Candidatus Kapabacteria bacterium]